MSAPYIPSLGVCAGPVDVNVGDHDLLHRQPDQPINVFLALVPIQQQNAVVELVPVVPIPL